MFIVATQDPRTRAWSEAPESGADAWGAILPIDAGLTQAEADEQLGKYLAGVQAGEALCIRAHGNDEEIGDAAAGAKDWGWTFKKLARMLATHLTAKPSVILIRSCAENVTNFPAHVAVRVESHWPAAVHLSGVPIYGYNTSVKISSPVPSPTQVVKNVQVQAVYINL
ncbi:hypothetical protein ACFQY4_35545 [Catellatospora bangladeshensis]|uniref:Uncharacterized protein n=1 Tax=Catellatospora bangladeshensis TaxID=310355 RepID=A0A8J3J9T2_9ACTN|nr:hypothetical protein [Catellatospora bangladeshensis]GIF80957.1 hypothetical protein Cba03nite_23060 [Catellatospora bangladeshensis]